MKSHSLRPGTRFSLALAVLACSILGGNAFASAPHRLPFGVVLPGSAATSRSLQRPSAGPAAQAPAPAIDFAGGTWRNFGLLQVSNEIAFCDPAHDQLLSIGGSRNESWELPLSGPHSWSYLSAPNAPLYINTLSSTVDPATGLVYSLADDGTGVQMHTFNPRTGAISVLPASGTPIVYYPYSLVFDSVSQSVVMTTFDSGNPYGNPLEVWSFNLLPAPSWVQLTPSGVPSPSLVPTRVVFDPVRHRLLYPDQALGAPQVITSLDLNGAPAWSTTPTNGLPNVQSSAWVYDAATDRVWTLDAQGEPCWLSMSTLQWSTISAGGAGPGPRFGAGIAIDPARHRLMVCGGQPQDFSDVLNDTWALTLDGVPTWVNLVAPILRPAIRGGASDGFDSARNRMIVFGGDDTNGSPINDTWSLALGAEPAWSPVTTQGGPPTPRFWHSGAWDEQHDRYVVYGGYDAAGAANAELWTLSFSGGTPIWSQLSPAGPAPSGRYLSQMVRDPVHDRFLLLFGYDGSNVLNDVWELRLSPAPIWRQMSPSGIPPSARAGEMCAFDVARNRVLIFGGSDNTSMKNDLLVLNLASGDGSWVNLGATNRPSGRNLGLLRLDAVHDRLLLFGGYGISAVIGNSTYISWLNDSWLLPLAGTPAWKSVTTDPPLPGARDRANGVYDPNYDRLILACGGIDGSNDTWGLYYSGIPTATLLSLASSEVRADRVRLMWAGADPGSPARVERSAPGGAWQSLAELNADGQGFVTLEDRDVTPGQTLEYRIGVPGTAGESYSAATQVQIPRLALSLAAHGLDGRVTFDVGLTSGDPARLELFDLAGRRVWTRDVGSLGPGSHSIEARDLGILPALYFVRLTQGAEARHARLVLVR